MDTVLVNVKHLGDGSVVVLSLSGSSSFSDLRASWSANTQLDPDHFRFCQFGQSELPLCGHLSDLLSSHEFALIVTAEPVSSIPVSLLGLDRLLSVRLHTSTSAADVKRIVAAELGLGDGRRMSLRSGGEEVKEEVRLLTIGVERLEADLEFVVEVEEWPQPVERFRKSDSSSEESEEEDSSSEDSSVSSDSSSDEEETIFASDSLHRLLKRRLPVSDQRLFLHDRPVSLRLSLGQAIASSELQEVQPFRLERRFSLTVRRGERLYSHRCWPSDFVRSLLGVTESCLSFEGRTLSPDSTLWAAGAAVDDALLSVCRAVGVRLSDGRRITLPVDVKATGKDLEAAVKLEEGHGRFDLLLGDRRLPRASDRLLDDLGLLEGREVEVWTKGGRQVAVGEGMRSIGVGVGADTWEKSSQTRAAGKEVGVGREKVLRKSRAKSVERVDRRRRLPAPRRRFWSQTRQVLLHPAENDLHAQMEALTIARRERRVNAAPQVVYNRENVGQGWAQPPPQPWVEVQEAPRHGAIVYPEAGERQPFPEAYPPYPRPEPVPKPAVRRAVAPPGADSVTEAWRMAADAQRNAAELRKNAAETREYWNAMRQDENEKRKRYQEMRKETQRYGQKAAERAERNRAMANRQIEADRQREAANFERARRQNARVPREARSSNAVNEEERRGGWWFW